MAEGPVIPGAEALSVAGGPVGVLVLHGFTGNPATMRPLAEALAEAGFTVELPRLPGHGTVVEDMMATGFADWSGAVEAAYDGLARRCDRVVVAGLSMGGTLACWLAARHPEIAGIVCINALVEAPEPAMVDLSRQMVAAGETLAPGIGSDVADPEAHESAYEGTPLRPVLSLFEAVEALQSDLPRIACPTLVMTSAVDHVVPPSNSDHLAARVSGPVERVTLTRSWHVATLDYDKDEIATRTIDFARKVVASPPRSLSR